MTDIAAVNRVIDDRREFTLLSCVPVALPYWRLRLRLELLAMRPISPLEAFAMRACRDASPHLRDIRRLLGLDERTFAGVITSVIANGWAVAKPGDVLVLTQQGDEVLEAGLREQAETRVISVEYDGLLRTPTFLNLPIEPQQRKSLGLRELPGLPGTAPDLVELQESFDDLQRLVRRSGDGRDQRVELLAVKGILRRERLYREATLAIMRSQTGHIQSAPVVDGLVSDEHEQRLATPELSRKMRIASEMRRGRQRANILPEPLRQHFDVTADEDAYALRRAARKARDTGDANASELSEKAQFATRALAIRTVPPHEHVQLLNTAFRSAQARLVIITPAVIAATIDRDLVTQLENCLGRDVIVQLVHEPEYALPASLVAAAKAWPSLRVGATRGLGRSILVRDDDLAVLTLFPILASTGLERRFRDERGWLLQRPENVRFVLAEVDAILERVGSSAPAGQ